MKIRVNEVHLWQTDLDRSVSDLSDFRLTLSPSERERADRFHFERDRKRFTAGRGVLREVLSRYLGCPPHTLQFQYNRYGKPRLVAQSESDNDIARQIQFNVSHSANRALYGFTLCRSIGVDIEQTQRDISFIEIAEGMFSPYERAVLQRQPTPEMIRQVFYNCWTRKEAYIKAHGMGLSMPLSSFDVALSPEEPVRIVATRPDSSEVRRWHLQDVRTVENFAAAAVVERIGSLKLPAVASELTAKTVGSDHICNAENLCWLYFRI